MANDKKEKFTGVMAEELAKLNSLLEESKDRQLTEDEIKTLFKITRKRIKTLKQKALNRLKDKKKGK